MTAEVIILREPFRIGSRVQLMGKGPIMTVLIAMPGRRWVYCIWLEGPVIRSEEFCTDDLTAVS
jgi:uncharacterized protein YodC (DUF2158 family)